MEPRAGDGLPPAPTLPASPDASRRDLQRTEGRQAAQRGQPAAPTDTRPGAARPAAPTDTRPGAARPAAPTDTRPGGARPTRPQDFEQRTREQAHKEEVQLRRLLVFERLIATLPEGSPTQALVTAFADSLWAQLAAVITGAVVMAVGLHAAIDKLPLESLRLLGAMFYIYYLVAALYFARFRYRDSFIAALSLIGVSILLFLADMYGNHEPYFAFRPTPVFWLTILISNGIATTIYNRYLDDLLARRIRIAELEREVRMRDEASGKIVKVEKIEGELGVARQAEKDRRDVVKHYSSLFLYMQELGRELKGDEIVTAIWHILKHGVGARAVQVFELKDDVLNLVKAFQATAADAQTAKALIEAQAQGKQPVLEVVDPATLSPAQTSLAPETAGLLGLVIRERKSYFKEDIERDPSLRRMESKGAVRTFCVFPLVDLKANRVKGLINVSECSRDTLGDEERQVLRTTANLAALALSHWETFQERERKALELRKKFETYVSPGVVKQIVDNPDFVATKRQKITVVFVDLRGFTSLSEALAPEVVVALLDDFFNHLTPVIFHYNGTLDKYIGDEIMALFGAPVATADDTRRAVMCCVEMRAAFRKVREKWATRLGRPVEIGIAINTGEAIVGSIGSEALKNYTAIGDAVNTAARLEGVTGPGKICMTRTTYDEVSDLVEGEWMPPVRVQGKALPLEFMELRAVKQPAAGAAPTDSRPGVGATLQVPGLPDAALGSSMTLARQAALRRPDPSGARLPTSPGLPAAGPAAVQTPGAAQSPDASLRRRIAGAPSSGRPPPGDSQKGGAPGVE